MLEKIEGRIKELEGFITQSVTNHNAIVGALNEAKHILELITPFMPQKDADALHASEAILSDIQGIIEPGASENAP